MISKLCIDSTVRRSDGHPGASQWQSQCESPESFSPTNNDHVHASGLRVLYTVVTNSLQCSWSPQSYKAQASSVS